MINTRNQRKQARNVVNIDKYYENMCNSTFIGYSPVRRSMSKSLVRQEIENKLKKV